MTQDEPSKSQTDEPLSPQEKKNRERLLEKVNLRWVEGVLEKSLYREALVQMGIPQREHPWDTRLRQPGELERTLPRGTRVTQVFHGLAQELLILGQPGSGKSTTLFELAKDMIAAAWQDESLPMPVVFNLSSWADESKPLGEWMIIELNTKYQVPLKVGKRWVENDQLLLLLDGLDEVKPEYQNACVDAINTFRTEHTVSLAVCSRIEDYDKLSTKLRLEGTILLLPLTPEQIDEYLSGFGDELATVRKVLKRDKFLQEMVETPLMLTILTLAYRGLSAAQIPPLRSVEAQRQHLFSVYVERMFDRRDTPQFYQKDKTTSYLSWLAKQMVVHEQTEFYIEGLQPDWLPQKILDLYSVGFGISGTLFGVFFILPSSLNLAPLFPNNLIIIILGLFSTILWLFLIAWIAYASSKSKLEVTETLRVSWRDFMIGIFSSYPILKRRSTLYGIITLMGLLVFASILEAGITVGTIRGIFLVAYLSVIFVPFIFLFLLFELLTNEKGIIRGQLSHRLIPNQGIWWSFLYANTIGLIVGTLLMLLFSIFRNTILGLTAGILFGLYYGGFAVLKHSILRLILYRRGNIPWNYRQFLDYAAERVFLRKVGGGYIFVHRLLMEYFAGLETSQDSTKASD